MSAVVMITAQDGSVREYTVDIQRGEPDRNNRLTGLEVKGGELFPDFSADRLSYVVDVPFAAGKITLDAIPASKFAKTALAVDSGALREEAGKELVGKDPSSKNAFSVDLSDRDRPGGDPLPLLLEVTAQDGGIRSYKINVRRAPPDSNAYLETLSSSAGVVYPAFDPRIASYTVRLPVKAGKFRLSLTAASPTARVAVIDEKGEPSGKRKIAVEIDPGITDDISFEVTAEDGTQRLYWVSVGREQAPAEEKKPKSDGEKPPAGAPSAELPATGTPIVDTPATRTPAAETPVEKEKREPEKLPAETPDAEPIVKTPEVKTPEVKPPLPKNGKDSESEIGSTRISALVPSLEPVRQAGNDHASVSMIKLRLGEREVSALSAENEQISDQASITVRYYRSNEIISRETKEISVQKQGKTFRIDMDYRSEGIRMDRDRLIEIEVAIPTQGGNYLHYTEAFWSDDEVLMELPFLLYGSDPRVAWPAVGSRVRVSGYVSLPPPGKVRGEQLADKEDFEKNKKGEYGISVELTDPATGVLLGRDTVWRRPGLPRGQSLGFGSEIEVREGMEISYTLTAKARNGRIWRAVGTAPVWTTMLEYEGGFRPASLRTVEVLLQVTGEPSEGDSEDDEKDKKSEKESEKSKN